MKTTTTKIIFYLLLFLIPVLAQTEQDSIKSVQFSDSLDISDDSVFVMQKSPMGAVLRSAIIPGLGQIYNESYWKAPIVWGAIGWFVYGWIENNKNYTVYRDRYLLSNLQTDKDVRDFYVDQRDLFAVYLGLTYFLNLIDAYIDAHLFDFEVVMNKEISTKQINFKIYF